MALGGEPAHVIRLLLGQGLTLAMAGVGIGLLGALLASRLLDSMLFGVEPTDPGTFAAVSGLLLVVALVASWMPARKAARIPPVEALRSD